MAAGPWFTVQTSPDHLEAATWEPLASIWIANGEAAEMATVELRTRLLPSAGPLSVRAVLTSSGEELFE